MWKLNSLLGGHTVFDVCLLKTLECVHNSKQICYIVIAEGRKSWSFKFNVSNEQRLHHRYTVVQYTQYCSKGKENSLFPLSGCPIQLHLFIQFWAIGIWEEQIHRIMVNHGLMLWFSFKEWGLRLIKLFKFRSSRTHLELDTVYWIGVIMSFHGTQELPKEREME